jgi:hypothetical protein
MEIIALAATLNRPITVMRGSFTPLILQDDTPIFWLYCMLDIGHYEALDSKDMSIAGRARATVGQLKGGRNGGGSKRKPEGSLGGETKSLRLSRPTLDALSKQDFKVFHVVLTSRPPLWCEKGQVEVSLGGKTRLAGPSLGGCTQKSAGGTRAAGSVLATLGGFTRFEIPWNHPLILALCVFECVCVVYLQFFGKLKWWMLGPSFPRTTINDNIQNYTDKLTVFI